MSARHFVPHRYYQAPLTLADGTKVKHRNEVCPECGGEGKSSAYLGAYTREQFDDQDDDFRDDYLSGRLDRPCEACKGNRVVAVSDDPRWIEEQRDLEEGDAIQESEMLMEGGWRELGWFGEG